MPAADSPVRATAEAIVAHALDRPPLLGGGRLVCVDGLAGSGKTTLATAVASAATAYVETVHVLHTDDLLTGWDGLRGVGPRLRNYVVGPLASGHAARYRRFDWELMGPAEEHVIAPMDLLVLEGCGSGHRSMASRRAALAFVSAPDPLRLERVLARDGRALRESLLAWMADEARYLGDGRDADFRVDDRGRLLA